MPQLLAARFSPLLFPASCPRNPAFVSLSPNPVKCSLNPALYTLLHPLHHPSLTSTPQQLSPSLHTRCRPPSSLTSLPQQLSPPLHSHHYHTWGNLRLLRFEISISIHYLTHHSLPCNDSRHHLSIHIIRHSKHRHLSHARVLHDRALNHEGRQLVACALDDVHTCVGSVGRGAAVQEEDEYD